MQQNQHTGWTEELQNAYSDPLHLLQDLGLTAGDVDLASDGVDFPFRVPRPFAARMRPADALDPLLLQVIPKLDELVEIDGYGLDPVGELQAKRSPALLQKYHGRALIIATGGCAINCRYCFRRHFPYANSVGNANIETALDQIHGDTTLSEVILSGGDPLLLNDGQIASIVDRIDAIQHVRRLRIHTRLPITIPARITDGLITILARARVNPVVVVHINHPNEIDQELSELLKRWSEAGIQLLNQSVLLRGVNDSATTLAELSESLFDAAVLPYYVHLLDPVSGAAHFAVDDTRLKGIVESLRARLPGYLLPRFVREIAGAEAKTPFM